MIYTDYFVKGRQPTTLCPLHPGGEFGNVVADMQGTSTAPQPRPQPTTGAGEPVPVTSAPPSAGPPAPRAAGAPSQAVPEPQPKKKGFWRRLFGGGRGGG